MVFFAGAGRQRQGRSLPYNNGNTILSNGHPMIDIGRSNLLVAIEAHPNGLLLDGGQGRTLLLPIEQVDRPYRAGESVEVFVYIGADGGPAATTQRRWRNWARSPGWRSSRSTSSALLPTGAAKGPVYTFAEQHHALRKGQRTLVRLYLDNQAGSRDPPVSTTGSGTMRPGSRSGRRSH